MLNDVLSRRIHFLAGLSLLLVHNLVDFNSTLFSIQLFALVGYVAIHRRYVADARFIFVGSRRVVVVLILGVLSLTFGYSHYGYSGMPVKYAELSDAINNASDPNEIDQVLRHYKVLHPKDVFGDLVAARTLRELRVTRERVLARVNVAMMLQPHLLSRISWHHRRC